MSRISGRDVLVLLKIAAHKNSRLSVRSIAEGLSLSASSVGDSMQRLRAHGLLKPAAGAELSRLSARDFLINGLRWVAPGSLSGVALGLRTGSAAEPLRSKLQGAEEMVMPLAGGPYRGVAVEPIDQAAPSAAQRDAELHKLLALADALRVGDARSRELAAHEIRGCL